MPAEAETQTETIFQPEVNFKQILIYKKSVKRTKVSNVSEFERQRA